MAVRMRGVLDRIEPEMPIALADTSRFGMAKSLFSAMGADSLERATESTESGFLSVSAVQEEPAVEHCDCPGCSPSRPCAWRPARRSPRVPCGCRW